MSPSIRPPTGSPGGATGIDAAPEVAPSSELSGTADVRRSESSAAASGAQAAQSPSAAWLTRLEAGQCTRAQAIDGLVSQALEAQGGARLAPAQRAELESLLRSALLEDPVLARLLGDP